MGVLLLCVLIVVLICIFLIISRVENIIYLGKGSIALEKNVCSALGGWSFLQV